jgi:hypothetical protein
MEKYSVNIVNDPQDDFNLMGEIFFEGEEVINIKRVNGEWKVVFFEREDDLHLPADLLLEVVGQLGLKSK